MSEEEKQMESEEEEDPLAPLDPSKKDEKQTLAVSEALEPTATSSSQKEKMKLAPLDPSKKDEKKRVAVSEALEPTSTSSSHKKKMKVENEHFEHDKENDGKDLDYPVGENEGGEGIVDQENSSPSKWTKKTNIYNFHKLCLRLHRPPEVVMAFILSELGTVGSLNDEETTLTIKGGVSKKRFFPMLKPLIEDYFRYYGTEWPKRTP